MLQKRLCSIVFLSLLLFAIFSCSQQKDYSFYYSGEKTTRTQLQLLFKTLNQQNTQESRFIINLEIARILLALNENAKLNSFLLDQINYYPDDKYNSYYLNIIANDFNNQKLYKMSEAYYKRIIRNHSTVKTEGENINEVALTNLVKNASSPVDRVKYGLQLIDEFNSSYERSQTHYILAKSYEELGLWRESILQWKQFLASPLSDMQGESNIRNEIKNYIRYYEYPNKNWIYTRLPDLLEQVRSAIVNRNNAAIEANRPKVNFFTLSWAQDYDEADSDFLNSLATYMRRPITFAAKPQISLNDQEAYWETNGWSHRITTWYLYFRRIDFQADPSIHGKWEWAGIYFGEKPYSSAN